MSIKEWWHLWLVEYRRREAFDARPARFAPPGAEGLALVGRWLAGASGIGIALSVSAMSSAYTSLTGVADDHICVASQFVSRTVEEAHLAATQFMLAGFLALIIAGFPRVVWVLENARLHDLMDKNTQPIPFELWASKVPEMKVFLRCVMWQIFPLIGAVFAFRAGLDHAFGLHLSSSAIQSMWRGFKIACG